MVRRTLIDFLQSAVPGYLTMEKVAGDASFRQYYRVSDQRMTYIVMDAPPEYEDVALFHQLATAFSQAGICVPDIIESDFEQGYLLLSDFGDETLDAFLHLDADYWLNQALSVLLKLQQQGGQHIIELPEYSTELLQQELNLFPTWFVKEFLQTTLSASQEKQLQQLNAVLIEYALKQPQVWVHRDYHCRNLMKLSDGGIGVIDFQDAVYGPITYDLVSLLKDCYIRYPQSLIQRHLENYYMALVGHEMLACEFDEFLRAFDFMGLQRHIKVLGIFSRLSIRDGKHDYLDDLPTVFDYVLEVLQKYQSLQFALPLFKPLQEKMHQQLTSSNVGRKSD